MAELLGTIADVLDNEILPDGRQHTARVAANLARILAREALLAPAALAHEHDLLVGLLGHGGDLGDLRAELTVRLRHGGDPSFERDAWEALVASVRDDLAIAKPGHDSWEGE
jgi:Domain of unknown function (DUF6285)